MAHAVSFTTTASKQPGALHLINGAPGRVHCGRPWTDVQETVAIVDPADPRICGLCRNIAARMAADLDEEIRAEQPTDEWSVDDAI